MDETKKYLSSLSGKEYLQEDQPSILNKPFFRQAFLLIIIWVVLLILRIPILANATVFLDPDEGVMASHLVDSIKSGNFSLYYEGTRYMGNFNTYLALPFFLLMGFTALAYKLPAVLCYGLYVWTFYLLAKKYRKDIALTVVILMVFCPPAILDLSTRFIIQIIVGILGNVLFLLADEILKNQRNNTNIFFLGLVIGFSIYVYSYSIVYVATVCLILILGNRNWHNWRGDSSLTSFLNPFKNCDNKKQIILRVCDIAMGGVFLGIFSFLLFKYIR